MKNEPNLPIALPQTGDLEGTWAYYTLSKRFGDIARRVVEENNFSKTIVARLERLIDEIPDAPLRQINDPDALDYASWLDYINPYLGLSWRKPPWFLTEHYFYRRIIEATGYFAQGEGFFVDPFQYQKRKGLEASIDSIRSLIENIQSLLNFKTLQSEIIERLLLVDLWGNQADLSLWPAEEDEKPDHDHSGTATEFILIDDSDAVNQHLNQETLTQIDFLIDNAGLELATDLIFSDYLISSNKTMSVHFHLKAHPTYVSDATITDVEITIQFLRHDRHKETQSLGNRLRKAQEKGFLKFDEDWFWNSPRDGWRMPDPLLRKLMESDLVISKGDAHYRRLLGDRHWPFDASFEEILAYYPAPLVALRTLKSELIVGLDPDKQRVTSDKDRDWLINGRWGVIQFRDK